MDEHQDARFELTTPEYRLRARGVAARLRPRSWQGREVARAAQELLAEAEAKWRASTPPLLLGVIPFDTDRPAHLYIPEEAEWGPGTATESVAAIETAERTLEVTGKDSPGYREAVAQGVARIRRGELDKVVLARTLQARTGEDFPLDELSARLQASNPTAYNFLVDLPADGDARGTLLGASPELVLSSRRGEVHSHPLAGSTARLPDAAADAQVAQELLASAKNLGEHALVARMVVDTFRRFSDEVVAPEGPELVQTPVLWHLGTPIAGLLREGVSPLELAYALHPTPAVSGWPNTVAKRAITELEDFDRGFYAGLVGWIDAEGSSEWALVLRCGIVDGNTATLYAGAGIVADSDPVAEHTETAVKFRTFANVLGRSEELQPAR